MAQELRADPDALMTLAAACLAAADTLGEHYRTGLGELTLPADAFGDTRASAALAGTAAAIGAQAQKAVSAHVDILEEDADALLQTAFAYLAADRQAAQTVGNARRAPL
ncbi:hypothetical protein ACQP1P_03140 [Dactylosporangium sp. CA-052675]|uniref:hypothetical protein n=1 Tax=Dactylosporangium sp. CA-052675 TaxID=3239927 RepID=UPI003D8C1841|nr:hypothetical protein GCM10020063_081660 [Dactylosporangium thailandense]